MYFFTSDTHLDHANIIKYCSRPFPNTIEMNAVIINNWNSVVNNNDTVYFVGDFAFSKYSSNLFSKLNGNKILIIGNHDKKDVKHLGWSHVSPFMEIDIAGQGIVLCHYAMRVWNNSFRGNWMLYGHSHGTLLEDSTLSCDVGTDSWGFKPVSFQRLQEKMNWKKDNKKYFTELNSRLNLADESLDNDVRKLIFTENIKINQQF